MKHSPRDRTIQAALKAGRRHADAILEYRTKKLQRRKKALKAHAKNLGITAEAAAPSNAGVLVAEGDSWFDYPLHDVLKLLQDDHGYDVESVAHKGDPVEEMAYADGQLDDFNRLIEKIVRNNTTPKAILLSGGGNDVAGSEFGMLLNHVRSQTPGLNEQVIAGVVDERIQDAYAWILGSVTRTCEQQIGKRLPILIHGYDYPVPDGRGFLGGWWFLPGPWLQPGFREKGYENLAQCTALAQSLIDRFNTMLKRVADAKGLEHVRYIDLRKTLSNGADYKKWWANELHPTERGFEEVTNRFVSVLQGL